MSTKPDTLNHEPGQCRILVGTSGYSYTEWAEAGFYPMDTKSGQMLPLYAREFPITELNYTWYQMPRAEVVERQRQMVPPHFQFVAKLTRTMTHEVDAEQWPRQAVLFRDGMSPLIQNKQLVAILIQFPPSFKRVPDQRRHLARLLDALTGLPLAVEFRHHSWATERVFEEMERRHITLASVDVPDLPYLFPATDVVTNSDLFYIRFHGRNAKGWRSGTMQKQFDYDYSDDELREWVQERIVPMSRKAKRGVIFFNNHVRAQAPRNAQQITALLEEQGLRVDG
jgi:uncharacterized protein YecE (DUF72 family)